MKDSKENSELWDIFKIQFNIPSVPSKYECITFSELNSLFYFLFVHCMIWQFFKSSYAIKYPEVTISSSKTPLLEQYLYFSKLQISGKLWYVCKLRMKIIHLIQTRHSFFWLFRGKIDWSWKPQDHKLISPWQTRTFKPCVRTERRALGSLAYANTTSNNILKLLVIQTNGM